MSQRGLPCRPCGPSCTTYSQRQVKERPSFWVRTGALNRTSQKVSLLPTHQMCGLGKHPAAWAASPGLPQFRSGYHRSKAWALLCQKRQALYFLAVFVSSSRCQPLSRGQSRHGFKFLFFGVCGVFCRSFTVLDCNRIAYLKTLRDLRCI